jgi:hypothetical protein
MDDSTIDDPATSIPDPMEIFEPHELGVCCRVCGSLVAADGEWGRVHWDWHEASNGA